MNNEIKVLHVLLKAQFSIKLYQGIDKVQYTVIRFANHSKCHYAKM